MSWLKGLQTLETDKEGTENVRDEDQGDKCSLCVSERIGSEDEDDELTGDKVSIKNWCFQTVVLEKTLESPLEARRSNQCVNSNYSLEGLMLKLKLQYFGRLMRRADSLENLDAGKD